MIIKSAKSSISFTNVSIKALNRPEGWEIYNTDSDLSISRMKIAGLDKTEDLDGFDLTEAVKKNPDHLFVKVFAIKKDEVNDNGDAFSEAELKKAANTFIGCPVFCNHANDDIEKARGKVVHAWYDAEEGGIYIISMVDKVAYPKLARGIEEGYITGTSMGCQVHHSLCSICHTKAHVSEEYCDHIKHRKTKKFSGKVKCKFHDSKCKPDEDCPICGKEKSDEKELAHKEAQIYEHNYGLKFIEDSFVVNPACHDCLVNAILNVPEFTKKVASISARMQKIASEVGSDKLIKVAGKLEVNYLNEAMKRMEVVAKSMMDQKEQVSMEYVSDIVDVLASLQTVTDELVEMGYAQISSPQSLQDPNGLADAVPTPGSSQPQQPQAAPQPQAPQSKPSGAASSPVGDIGTVTKPSFSAAASGNLKDFTKVASKLKKQIAAIELKEKLSNSHYRLTKDDITVIANKDEIGNLTLTALYGDEAVITKETGLESTLNHRFVQNSEEVANELINEVKAAVTLRNTKEPESMDKELEKTAAGKAVSPEKQQVTTEKQLADAKLDLHPRTETAPEGITESKEQLGLSKEPVNDTTSESPQVRKHEYATVTTQGQLVDFTDSPLARWNDAPDVITEKSWTDFSRLIGSELSTDQSEHITEGQIEDLLSHHRWTEPKVTTENQLKDDANWLSEDNTWVNKGAAANYAKALVTSAVEAISDAVAYYKHTPSEIAKAAKFISKDPQSQIKAAFLVLANGSPKSRKSRQSEIARASYFGKAANDVSSVDALLACMGDNCLNLKAEDFVDAVRFVATDSTRMAAVEGKVQTKLAKKIEVEEVVDKFAAFEDAFKSITEEPVVKEASAENDGLYEVTATFEEVGADLSDEVKFVTAAEKFARSHVKGAKDAVLYSVSVDLEAGAVVTTLKEASKLTSEEKTALKEAQMMGGQMGGGMDGGGAGGGGASMPAPPGGAGAPGDPAGAPPVESLQGAPGEEPGAGAEEGGDKEAMPPGSICPVCGSEDVDIVDGKGKCNNCNSQFVFKVQVEVTRWTGVNDKNSDDEGGDSPLGGDASGSDEGAGFPMPEAGTNDVGGESMPNIPVAAMTRLNPASLKKVANKLGSVSPLTGSTNTAELGNGKYLCMDTGATYELVTVADSKNPTYVWAEWRWTPKVAGTECASCRRAKASWNSALKSVGMTSEQFESLSFTKKADTILQMDAKGLFRAVKTASKNSSVIAEFKKAFTVEGKFPIESCREKLARRYGEEAVAISGPCKGEKIYDCVCDQLKNAGVYNDRLAEKVAASWHDRDGCLECIEDYTRFGYEIEKAASICNHMKVRYASPEDMFAEELGDTDPTQPTDPKGGPGGAPTDAPTDDFGAEDPFAADGGMGGDVGSDIDGVPSADVGIGGPGEDTAIDIDVAPDGGAIDVGLDPTGGGGAPGENHGDVTIKLPLSALDAIEQAIDKAHGEDPAGEAHHDIPSGDLDKTVDVDIPAGAADELEAPIENALDQEVGGGEEGGEESSGFGDKPEASLPTGDSNEGADNASSEGGDNSTDKGPEMSEEKKPDADHFANVMRKGKRVGQIDLDVAAIARVLQKKVAGESEPKLEKAQDAVGKIQDKKTMGNEEKFDPSKPSVPRGQATIGKEPSDLNPKDKPLPKVPSGGGEMGHEKEMGYTADGVSMTGGDKGQGKTDTASAKNKTKVAESEKTEKSEKNDDGVKVKGEGKKVGPAKPVSEQVPVEFSNNKDLSTTPESMKRVPFEESDSKEVKNIPEKGEGAFMGDEKSSIGDVPKADSKFAPNIPVGGGRNEKYDKNDKNEPEHQTDIKGTRIAESDEKSKIAKQTEEATRIAGKMIEAGIIDANQLMKKIAELSTYKVEQLADYEKQLFKSAKKGLAAESDGIERSPVIISENSNQRSKPDLTTQLQSLSSLHQRNVLASQTDADVLAKLNRR